MLGVDIELADEASDDVLTSITVDPAVQAELVARFDEEALPLLVPLYNHAYRLTRDPDKAQDLVQDTFAKAFAAFHQYQPGTNIKAWMYRIMQNTFISAYRKEMRGPILNSVDELADWQLGEIQLETGAAIPSAETEALENLPDTEVRAALLELPEQFRTAVFLADAEGFSYNEISEILGVPMGTVMSRIYRGRKALRAALREVAIERGISVGDES